MTETKQFETAEEAGVSVVDILQKAGHTALFAGGCVRDHVMQLPPKDYDVATSALPDAVEKLFEKTVPTGKSFGVITVVVDDKYSIEVATFRADGEYLDGRRPLSVEFKRTAEHDATRRDFTINGMFFDPVNGKISDYVGGREDIKVGRIRAIGEPRVRFEEDKLRMLRAVRFAALYGFGIHHSTLTAIRKNAEKISDVSVERVREELFRMFSAGNPYLAVKLLRSTGLFNAIFPNMKNRHTMEYLMSAYADNPYKSKTLGMAVLLSGLDPEEVKRVCTDMKMSNADKFRIYEIMVNQSAFGFFEFMRPHMVKHYLSLGSFPEALCFYGLRCAVLSGKQKIYNYAFTALKTITGKRLNPDPLLTGKDLIDMGYKPGPVLGRILKAVRFSQLDEKTNTKEEAIEFIVKWAETDETVKADYVEQKPTEEGTVDND